MLLLQLAGGFLPLLAVPSIAGRMGELGDLKAGFGPKPPSMEVDSKTSIDFKKGQLANESQSRLIMPTVNSPAWSCAVTSFLGTAREKRLLLALPARVVHN